MRKSVLARLVFAVSAVCGIGVWVACGGSDDQDVTNVDAGFDAGRTEEEDSYRPPVDSGPKDSGPTQPDDPYADAGPETVVVVDGGPDGGIKCFEGGELEDEPNNNKATANEFPEGVLEEKYIRRVLCGYLHNTGDGGADGGESDWAKFELGDASPGFFIKYFGGGIKVNVEVDGQAPVDITVPDASLGARRIGQSYYVEVRSTTGDAREWRLVVFEDRPKP